MLFRVYSDTKSRSSSKKNICFFCTATRNVGVLESFANFAGTLVLEFLFNEVAGLQVCNFIKMSLQYRCFPVKFAKVLRTSFYRTPPMAVSESQNLFCKLVVMFYLGDFPMLLNTQMPTKGLQHRCFFVKF